MSSDQRYSQKEVDAILKRALEREDKKRGRAGGDALSHQDLLETAKEVGIEPSQVEAAIAEYRREGDAIELRAEWQKRQGERLAKMARAWAFVSVLCTIINFATGGVAAGAIWFPWVILPWGAVLAMRWFALRSGPSSGELEKLQSQLTREQRKRELEARFERGAQVLGSVVEEGAKLLAAHLDERTRRIDSSRRDAEGRLPPKL